MDKPSTTYQLMPSLTRDEYETLKADIEVNGVQVAVEVDENGDILDGYHRAKICQELGMSYPKNVRSGLSEEEKLDFAVRINLNRRQLSREQRQELSLKLRRQGWSYRRIGDALKITHTTARSDAESSVRNLPVDLPERTVGKDGRERPATMPKQKEVNGEVKPVTKAQLREVVKYAEAVEKYPQLATLPHGKAIKEAQKMESTAPQQLTEADTLIFLLNRITRPIEEAAETIESSLSKRPKFTEVQIEQLKINADVFLHTAHMLTSYIKNNSREASRDEIACAREGC